MRYADAPTHIIQNLCYKANVIVNITLYFSLFIEIYQYGTELIYTEPTVNNPPYYYVW